MENFLTGDYFYWLLYLIILFILSIVSLFYFIKPKDSKFVQLKTDESSCEVIIIGSGILGSALATVLARDGRRVTVVERDLKEPDRIVGELLQPGGCKALKMLGLLDCIEGIDGHTIMGYVVHDKCSSVDVTYPDEFEGIRGGKAFHHGRFVMSLRKAAMAEPNVTYVEGTVNKLLEDADGIVHGVQYTSGKDDCIQKELEAPLVVVADGCFSRLRKGLVKESPKVKSHFVALLMKNCPQARDNFAEIVLVDPSPVLVYQISSSCTRVLVDIRGKMPKDIPTYLKENIYHQLPEHLRDPFVEAIDSSQIRSMPNNFLPPAPIHKKGVVCLGDALNMRHPLTGGGMSVAFCDVVICRELLKNITDLSDYDAVSKATHALFMRRKNSHSFVVNVLSMALYELFAANDENTQCLKEACFRYFQLGGECVAGPVALLSILKPKPLLLVSHFFAVAIYAVYIIFQKGSFFSMHYSFYRSTCVLLKACQILFPLIWSEVKH